jgi:hypothetical protein
VGGREAGLAELQVELALACLGSCEIVPSVTVVMIFGVSVSPSPITPRAAASPQISESGAVVA